jgi:hypothetical protein
MTQQVDKRVETGVLRGANARRDPFRHGDLPQRPNYLPEEGDVGRSDMWAIVKGVIALLAFIAGAAWLLTL